MDKTNILEKAINFAKEKHKGQVRKYTNEPYFQHLENVANLVTNYLPDDSLKESRLSIAYLHDVLEDTDANYQELITNFGNGIAIAVLSLSDNFKEGNRAIRKKQYEDQLKEAGGIIQTIKYADLIDNTSTIVKYDRKFSEVYLVEKLSLLFTLKKGNPRLRQIALGTVANAIEVYANEEFKMIKES